MEADELTHAQDLIGAYSAAINLYGHLQSAGLKFIGSDAIEVRDLIFAEMLSLYIQTERDDVRKYFHEVGIGDRLLEEACVILRGEGARRLERLQTLASNLKQIAEGPEVRLLYAVGRPVT